MIPLGCPHCRQILRIIAEPAGKTVRCPACEHRSAIGLGAAGSSGSSASTALPASGQPVERRLASSIDAQETVAPGPVAEEARAGGETATGVPGPPGGENAPVDRVHAGLLLRTGSPGDAAVVLRAAIRNRAADAAPVEELLLAVAHLRLKQPAEARRHLRSAVAWMHRGSEPVRAAALAGLAARSPLAALAALPLTPPDPRLLPLDQQTAHELTALRAEVEMALAKQKP